MSKIINLSARTFRSLVEPVLPSAGNDVSLPVLSAVHIESTGEWLIATATNRFLVAKKRIPAPADEAWPEFTALVSTRAIRNILATFKPVRGVDPDLTFEVSGDLLAVSVGGGLVDDVAEAHATYHLVLGEFPKTNGIFTKALAADAAPVQHGFNWKFLSSFASADADGAGLQVKAGATARDPMLVIGDNFIGAIMPKRVDAGQAADDWAAIIGAAKEFAA